MFHKIKRQFGIKVINFMDVSPAEKPPVMGLSKNFPVLYTTQMFITMFTRTLHQSLS